MTKKQIKKELEHLEQIEKEGYFWIGCGEIASGIATPGQIAVHYHRKKELRERLNE